MVTAPTAVPLRVDIAGGWLDVPRFARSDGYIVNVAISPLVSLTEWPYERFSGLGGSGAWQLLNGKDAVESELNNNVGWQDPAIIAETGLCAWKSGPKPKLWIKVNPEFMAGKLALYWTGKPHVSANFTDWPRNYDAIVSAGYEAENAVRYQTFYGLVRAVQRSKAVQLAEGMAALPAFGECASKYCGSGHGGYAAYFFETTEDRNKAVQQHGLLPVEPFLMGR